MPSTSLPSASRVGLTPPSASFSPGVRPYLQHACACGLTYPLQMRRTSVRRRSAQRAYPCSWPSGSAGAFSARKFIRQLTGRATCVLSHLPVVLLLTNVCNIEKDSWVRARQHALCGHDVNGMYAHSDRRFGTPGIRMLHPSDGKHHFLRAVSTAA
jgi:hypothetical protein